MLEANLKEISLYTDGACSGNPGPGGYGVVLIYQSHRKELYGGYKNTTNNRMELMAAIVGLRSLKEKCKVTVYSDSEYLVKAIKLGWALKWRANNWRRNRKEKALNPDLWGELLSLCEYHLTDFVWVKGHANNPDNNRCDQLAVNASLQPNLPIDKGYTNGESNSKV